LCETKPDSLEAVTGALTMRLEPECAKTRISWVYVVGGYMRAATGDLAPLVDGAVGEQLLRFATSLGAKVDLHHADFDAASVLV